MSKLTVIYEAHDGEKTVVTRDFDGTLDTLIEFLNLCGYAVMGYEVKLGIDNERERE